MADARLSCCVDRGAVLLHPMPELDGADQQHPLYLRERVARASQSGGAPAHRTARPTPYRYGTQIVTVAIATSADRNADAPEANSVDFIDVGRGSQALAKAL